MTAINEPEAIRITSRFPPDVHVWLAREAAANERSINRQLIYAVRKVIKQEQADESANSQSH